MLEQNGLNLQNANVSQQDKGQNDNSTFSESEHFMSQSAREEKTNANNGSDANESSQSKNYILEAFA